MGKYRTHNMSRYRTPIESLSVDLELPMSLARLLVGATEEETEDNIKVFRRWYEERRRQWERE